MQAKPVFIGVDVAKATLVVCIDGTAARVTVANEEQPIQRWLATLPCQAVIGMESTGCYHLKLAQAVHGSGRVAYVLNAADVYYYAKGLGARSKTDRVDAGVIARYVTEHHRRLHAWCPGSEVQVALQTLLQRRANLVRHQVAVRQLMRAVSGLEESARDLEREFDQVVARIDRQVRAYLAKDAQLKRRCDLLRTIVGIGPQVSALLAALFSRIAFANADALVAYSGLDPSAHESGPRSGRRRLSKRGNAELRRMLYVAGLAASHSKVFGPLYRSYKARGFKPIQALVILGRKLLRIAWAIWNHGRPFDPSRIALPKACAQT